MMAVVRAMAAAVAGIAAVSHSATQPTVVAEGSSGKFS